MAMAESTGADDATVLVSRNGSPDDERYPVGLEHVTKAFWTDVTGGDCRDVGRWALAVKLPPSRVPFARSGRHADKPNQGVTAIVEMDRTAVEVLRDLQMRAEDFAPERRFMRRRRRLRGIGAARAVLAYMDEISAAAAAGVA